MLYINTSLFQHFFIPTNGNNSHQFRISNISLLGYILVPIPSHISPQKPQQQKSIQKLLKYKFHKISKQSPTESRQPLRKLASLLLRS